MLVAIRELSEALCIHPQTLRNLADAGTITAYKTPGGHRRFDVEEVRRQLFDLKKYETGTEKTTILYARVSSNGQKNDLKFQKEKLELHAAAKGWKYEVIEDVGSGLNYRRPGFNKMINLILEGKVERVVVNYMDRLCRFGHEMVEAVCVKHGVELVVITQTEDKSFEQELVEDLVSIVTVFSARIYGSRSHKNKAVVDAVKKEIEAK